MSSITPIPFTAVENSIIDECPSQIGIYGLGIYVAIKRFLNTKTGDCYPSYKTIAKKLHVDRSTVIRYVKKMKDLKIISPEWRFKEDGSHTSNQYNFQATVKNVPAQSIDNATQSQGTQIGVPSKMTEKAVQIDQDAETSVPSGGGIKPLAPSRPEPPEQEKKKKERTISEVDFMATEKQKTCPHPPALIVILPDNITICNHCYGLLDENLKLVEEKTPAEIVEAA